MPNATNVTAGKPMIGGAVHVAPIGTALPTSTSAALNEAFVDLGYMSDAGVTNDISRETTDIKAWGGDTVLNIQTSKNDNWTFTMIEAKNINVLKQVFGEDNVTESNGAITVKVNSKELDAHSWVFDMLLSDGSARRHVLPNAKITNIAEITYADSSAVGYNTTLAALPDSTGQTHYEYTSAS